MYLDIALATLIDRRYPAAMAKPKPTRLQQLREHRAALADTIDRLRTKTFSHIIVPPLERQLQQYDELIAREAQSSEG